MDSSLDRFIRDRAAQLIGIRWGSRGAALGLAINALVQSLVGGILLAISSREPELLWVGAGMLALGIGCGIGALFAKRKMQEATRPETRLSAEGQRLVIKLASHVGWSSWAGGNGGCSQRFQWSMGRRTCSQVMHESAFELLDAAAAQYNRVSGLVQIQGAYNSPTIDKMRPAIREALNDTMIGVVNQVALLEASPETASAVRIQVIDDIAILAELGDRIETIRAQTPSLTDRLSSSSPILDVIEQLKMDEAARSELHGGDSELRHRG
ncbi:MAG: hypothetical protein HONBIEJF_00462 [Fimbriimonadaceae bacterium]|nr:hypothetical protein [Fimbriimonadaceae bacterium]